uniref:Formin-like protein 14 n=1 Tax=Tanacetum cinerariifolium TaxID=118510 RepID=A0A699GHD0_TANCI|nr:formin-like protein 14 [Tanacetum cinerariifolium]
MFKKARDENEQIAEAEKKKLEKEAQKEHSSANKKEGVDVDSKKDLRNMIRDTSLSIKMRDAVKYSNSVIGETLKNRL